MKTDKLLLTTDLSAEALQPLEAILSMAERMGMEITMLHVVEDVLCTPPAAPIPPTTLGPSTPERMELGRKLLEAEAELVRGLVPIRIDVVCASDVARKIADYADENEMAMIAISTHGRSGFRRMVMGSTAENVIRRARVPVVVFPAGDPG